MGSKIETRCPECGAKMMHEVRKDILVYRGHKIEYEQPGLYCTKCDNCHLSDKDVAGIESKLFAFRAKVDSDLAPLLPPSKIKVLRKSLNLTQKRAGELFGGGPMAFSKYERGEYKQPLSTDILLRLLASKKIGIEDVQKTAVARPRVARGCAS
jgi:HTH-type transcriptional regulator / antitoxin MqsA